MYLICEAEFCKENIVYLLSVLIYSIRRIVKRGFDSSLCAILCRYDYSGYGQSSGKVCKTLKCLFMLLCHEMMMLRVVELKVKPSADETLFCLNCSQVSRIHTQILKLCISV